MAGGIDFIVILLTMVLFFPFLLFFFLLLSFMDCPKKCRQESLGSWENADGSLDGQEPLTTGEGGLLTIHSPRG